MKNEIRQNKFLAALAVLVIGLGTQMADAAEVKLGTSRAEVVDILGNPDGTVTMGKLEFLQYERGTVELEDGVVTSSTVVSEAEHERRLEANRKQAEEATRQAEMRRANLLREGRAEKERVLADNSVSQLPADDQVRYWQKFAKTYPDVDVTVELADAKTAWAAETKRRDQEIAEAQANQPPPMTLSSRRQRKLNRGRHSSETSPSPESRFTAPKPLTQPSSQFTRPKGLYE